MEREDPYRYPVPHGPANMDGERATISLITMRSHINELRTLTLTDLPAALNNDIIIRRASKRGSRGDYRTPAPDNTCYESQVVSREHAIIIFDTDTNKATLRDNFSTHGTWLNGRQLAPGGSEPLPDHSYIRCGVDVVRGVETFPALVLEVFIRWADDPNYQNYFPIAASHFDHAHKWGPQTIYGEHLPVTPLTSSNTFRVPDDSDIEELPEEPYVEDLEALHDSDVEEVTMEHISPHANGEDVTKVNDVVALAISTDKPAEACDTKSITDPYPSPSYPVPISSGIGLETDLGSKNKEESCLAVDVGSGTIIVPPIMNDPEDDSEADMESDSDESEYPEAWNKSHSDDETEDIEEDPYLEFEDNSDDSDDSGEVSDGSEDSDDGSEAPEHMSAFELSANGKYIDPGLLVQSTLPSIHTVTSALPTQTAALCSPNTINHVKTEDSRELNTRVRLPTLEGNAQVCPVNPYLDCSVVPQPRYPGGPCNLSTYFSVDDPIQHRKPHRATYTDGPFQSPVAAKVSSLTDGLDQLPCASLKRKASKIEVNDHEDKIVISATESPVDTKQSAAVEAITSALSESDPEPSTKRVKTSHPPSNVASHATTAVVSAVLGALSTIALLAALPTEYFQ